MTSLSRSWHLWDATASVACVARLGTVADWWRSWLYVRHACVLMFVPMVAILNIPCDCQFFLFSVYLMNFMFHTTLDATRRPNILRVHYKSMKCDVSFSQGSVIALFRWGEHVFSCVCKNVLPAYSSAKIIFKNQTSFSRVIITNVLPRFNESQCGCTRIVYVNMTLTRSKVKVKITGLLKFQKSPNIALFYVYLLRHFGVQLKNYGWSW